MKIALTPCFCNDKLLLLSTCKIFTFICGISSRTSYQPHLVFTLFFPLIAELDAYLPPPNSKTGSMPNSLHTSSIFICSISSITKISWLDSAQCFTDCTVRIIHFVDVGSICFKNFFTVSERLKIKTFFSNQPRITINNYMDFSIFHRSFYHRNMPWMNWVEATWNCYSFCCFFVHGNFCQINKN